SRIGEELPEVPQRESGCAVPESEDHQPPDGQDDEQTERTREQREDRAGGIQASPRWQCPGRNASHLEDLAVARLDLVRLLLYGRGIVLHQLDLPQGFAAG